MQMKDGEKFGLECEEADAGIPTADDQQLGEIGRNSESDARYAFKPEFYEVRNERQGGG